MLLPLDRAGVHLLLVCRLEFGITAAVMLVFWSSKWPYLDVDDVVATCQPWCSHTLKHILLYSLFYSNQDYSIQNGQHAVLKSYTRCLEHKLTTKPLTEVINQLKSSYFLKPVESPPCWPLEIMQVQGAFTLASVSRLGNCPKFKQSGGQT